MNMLFGYTPEKFAQEYCSRYGGDASTMRAAIERGDCSALTGMQKKAKEVVAANPALAEEAQRRFKGFM